MKRIIIKRFLEEIEKDKIDSLKRNQWNDNFEVTLPKWYFYTGYVCAVGFLLAAVAVLFLTEGFLRWFSLGISILFVVLGGILAWTSKIWGIIVYKSKGIFVYRTFFARSYEVNFDECRVVSSTENTIKLKAGSKTFYVDPHALNIELLLDTLNK